MTKDEITRKLVNTYTDLIVCDGDIVQIEETVDNIAARIMDDFDEKRQKKVFGVAFENEDDCYDYLLNDLSGLLEACQEKIWSL